MDKDNGGCFPMCIKNFKEQSELIIMKVMVSCGMVCVVKKEYVTLNLYVVVKGWPPLSMLYV